MNFRIYTPPHTMFAALHLSGQLAKLGIRSKIVDEIKPGPVPYIIYNASSCVRMPKDYIIMQTEIPTSHWFNDRYRSHLNRAKAIWDYSPENLSAYPEHKKKACVVGPGIWKQPAVEKDIDFLFYGWIDGSARRKEMVKQLKKNLDLNVVTKTTGPEMWKMLARTKVVLNVHYYENSPLERFRVNESLSHGCHVISEGVPINELPTPIKNDYAGIVAFERSAYRMAMRAIDKTLQTFDYGLGHLDNLKEIEAGLKIAGL